MQVADLAVWTPVALTIAPPRPSIDWCDLSDLVFSEPFFSQTLIRIGDEAQSRDLVTTELAALGQVESAVGGRDPDGFIFHVSRCGSTLVSQLAAALEGVAVLSEAEPVNTLLQLDPATVDVAMQVECLRLLLRAFGRGRVGARKFLVKFSSWNLLYLDVLRRAFPEVPCVFVARDPAEIVPSILAGRPGWMRLRGDPERARSLLGIAAETVSTLDDAGFCVAVLERFFATAVNAEIPRVLFVDYGALPGIVWERVLPLFGIVATESERATLAAAAQNDAKSPGLRFAPDGAVKRAALASDTAYLVEQRLGSLYRRYLQRCAA
jgi:hypothetical protein